MIRGPTIFLLSKPLTHLHLHHLAANHSIPPAVPVLTVDDLQVHVDPRDEHLAVDADLVDGGRGQGVSHHHHPHDLIGHRAAVSQGHPDPQTTRDVDHLQAEERKEESFSPSSRCHNTQANTL